jgi:soluble lytic murein transglycosylase-like protein
MLALARLGKDAELLRAVTEARTRRPAQAQAATDELLWYEALAASRLGKAEAPTLVARLLVERSSSPWSDFALALAEGYAAARSADPAILEAGRLRTLIRAKDYAGARASALLVPGLALSAGGNAELLAEAGKAFLYAGQASEGLPRFTDIATEAVALGQAALAAGDGNAVIRHAKMAWNAAFYRARFLRALGRDAEAVPLLEALAANGATLDESEAALWYATEARLKLAPQAAAAAMPEASSVAQRAARARRIGLDALLAAYGATKAPSRLADLADPWLRSAIAARDWAVVEACSAELGKKLTPALAARVDYLAGRAAELSYAGAAPKAEAPARFRRLLSRTDAPAYYRILASRRLGEPSTALPAPAQAAAPPAPQGAQAEKEAFLRGLLPFGLAEEAWAVVRQESSSWDESALRRLSLAFAAAGDYPESMRAILALAARPGFRADRRDWELMFPRAYLEVVRALEPRPAFPEEILFGLVRSESFFRAEVQSSAGAIGLSQLMPATAAEVARAMRLADYDIEDPADNLAIGMRFFGDLLRENGGRPLRAMWAYNAGRSRLRAWLAEAAAAPGPALPDDLLLESLTIEETRQYGRNIMEAAVRYGTLYYGRSEAEVVDAMLEGIGK